MKSHIYEAQCLTMFSIAMQCLQVQAIFGRKRTHSLPLLSERLRAQEA